jgi:hypothetical protein
VLCELPYFVIAVIFAVLFVILGIHIDKMLYPNWIGKDYGYTGLSFGISGIFLSLLFSSVVIKKIYKIFVPKKHYNNVMIIYEGEKASKKAVVFFVVLCVFVSVLFFNVMAFTGIAVTENETVVNKDFAFSKVVEQPLEDTEIAIVKGSYSGKYGYSVYADTAYAFKVDDEWIDFGIPNEEAKEIIENAIEKYDKSVKTYREVNDIE